MTNEDYSYLRKKFLMYQYDTPQYPASVARVMADTKVIDMYLLAANQSAATNIKLYVRWLRKLRDTKLFPGNSHTSKPSKFVGIFGITKSMVIYDLIVAIRHY